MGNETVCNVHCVELARLLNVEYIRAVEGLYYFNLSIADVGQNTVAPPCPQAPAH